VSLFRFKQKDAKRSETKRNEAKKMLSFDSSFEGSVQQKLTGVKSGINRKLMIWAWAAWGLFDILRGLGP
jgi:hypothetical protein